MRRVLVVDDSNTSRLLLQRILDADPQLEVVGLARDGQEAVERARELAPDVIVMDVEMPRLDGLEATRIIMRENPAPIIIVTASLAAREVDVSLEAQRGGAVLAMLKPPGPLSPDFERRAEHLRRMVRLMADVHVVRHRDTPSLSRSPRRLAPRVPKLIAMAASTGGPAALLEVLQPLPADFEVPIVIVQHIAEGFAHGLARWLNAECAINVAVANADEIAAPGRVYLSPDNGHLEVAAGLRLTVRHDEPINGFRPSADALFTSAAASLGQDALAVILTGMGTDGARGLEAVHREGGVIVAQDEATSVIWSMPRAAVTAGIADLVLPIGEIGRMLVETVRGRRRGLARP